MRKNQLGLLLAFSAVLLTGCSGLAKLQMRHVQLANGSQVTIDQVAPTDKWQCREVAPAYSVNWGEFQMQYQAYAHKAIQNKAIDNANQQKIKANYIYIEIPNTLSVMGVDTHWHARAYAHYYQCKLINPDLKVGTEKHTEIM